MPINHPSSLRPFTNRLFSPGGTFLSITTHYTNEGSGFVCPSACAKSGVETMMKQVTVSCLAFAVKIIYLRKFVNFCFSASKTDELLLLCHFERTQQAMVEWIEHRSVVLAGLGVDIHMFYLLWASEKWS